jgi:hypothetical protein
VQYTYTHSNFQQTDSFTVFMVEYVQPDAYSVTIPAQVYPQLNYRFAIESRMHVLQSTENILMHTPDSLCLKSLSVITADKICFAARGLRLTINRRATMFRKRKKQSHKDNFGAVAVRLLIERQNSTTMAIVLDQNCHRCTH